MSPVSWAYFFVRLLFKFVLKIFYGTIVVENADLIPKNGSPCIVCANHSNSLTDALLLVTSVPSDKRGMLRLTAKSTQFGHKTFTSWLIEAAGTVPIKRRQDFSNGQEVDNTEVMGKLMEALELGDAVCLFPEGSSRFHPSIQPLKTGVARIISDVLSRNRDNPDFEIYLQTCSVTYMHRQHFRSDVLVTFHKPMRFTPKDNPELLTPIDFKYIRALTSRTRELISSGTIDSPSWELVGIAKLAAQLYAPLGTRMTLGDHVRVIRTFLEAFKEVDEKEANDADAEVIQRRCELRQDLKAYREHLTHLGVTDARIQRPMSLPTLLGRIPLRLVQSAFLLLLSLPGLLLWLPIFVATHLGVRSYLKSGKPAWDTFDEIAQTKLTYGLMAGLAVWLTCIMATLPLAFFTALGVPIWMWFTLRWMEDGVASLRGFLEVIRVCEMRLGLLDTPDGGGGLEDTRERRRGLYQRVMNMATDELGMPSNPKQYFVDKSGERERRREKGRVRGRWQSGRDYFSVRRRRKRDWSETMKLYDIVEYPDEDK